MQLIKSNHVYVYGAKAIIKLGPIERTAICVKT